MRRLPAYLLFTGAAFAQQSALNPGGRDAAMIRNLGVLFLWLLGLIFIIVIVIAILPVALRHRGIAQEPLERTHLPSAATERKLGKTVAFASVTTVLIIFGLVIVSVSVGKSTEEPADRANSLAIEIIGNQWWWYVRYLNDDASRILVTANELHIPVGRSVMIRGESNDVIHSFWVPGLQGKRDLIPSRVTTEWLEADRPERLRGQCAEFCGLQHAHMALWVIAEPEQQFEAWLSHQLQPSVEPSNADLDRGREVFLNNACVLCHTIEGTPAAGQVGPDLTHFASRSTLAAGTLPNNKGNLAGWIADPQTIKPGNHMATVPVKAADMQPLVDYLESLQ